MERKHARTEAEQGTRAPKRVRVSPTFSERKRMRSEGAVAVSPPKRVRFSPSEMSPAFIGAPSDPCEEWTQQARDCYINFQVPNGANCASYCLENCHQWMDKLLVHYPVRALARRIDGSQEEGRVSEIVIDLLDVYVDCAGEAFLVPNITIVVDFSRSTQWVAWPPVVRLFMGPERVSGIVSAQDATNLVCHYIQSAARGFQVRVRLEFEGERVEHSQREGTISLASAFAPFAPPPPDIRQQITTRRRTASDISFEWAEGSERQVLFGPREAWEYDPSRNMLSLWFHPEFLGHEPNIAMCEEYVQRYLWTIGSDLALQLHHMAIARLGGFY